MAAKFDWGDGLGKVHTIPLKQHQLNVRTAQGKVTSPPPGTYDPNLDAAQRSSQRGLSDLISDVAQGRERSSTDFGLGQAAIGASRTRMGEDYNSNVGTVNQNFSRSLADLLTARQQGTEDYHTNLASLDRTYQTLGSQQAQTARNAGAIGGSGAYAQAARKRTMNEALDKAPIDTAFRRFNDQSNLSETRLGEDKTQQLSDLLRGYTRGGADLDTQVGQLGLNYQRGNEDLTTQQSRAQREASQFGLDTEAAKQAQYGGNPIVLPRAATAAEQARLASVNAQAAARKARQRALTAARR
jgi:hypothetical protein